MGGVGFLGVFYVALLMEMFRECKKQQLPVLLPVAGSCGLLLMPAMYSASLLHIAGLKNEAHGLLLASAAAE